MNANTARRLRQRIQRKVLEPHAGMKQLGLMAREDDRASATSCDISVSAGVARRGGDQLPPRRSGKLDERDAAQGDGLINTRQP